MAKFGRLTLVVLLIMALMAGIVGCGKKAAENQGDAAKKEMPTLRIGSETTFPPFEMVDEKGNYIGFDMDLIRAIGKEAGFNVEIVSMGFDGLIAALQAGNIDVAASGMTITEERKKSVDFSDPYYDAGLMIAVRADQTGLDTPDKLAGKTIGVQIGTTGAKYANELAAKYPGTKVRTFNTVDMAFADLNNKGVDAVINDRPVTADYIKKGHPEVKMVGDMLTGEQYGFAVKKGNAETLKMLNEGLKKVKESGEYDTIYKKYFGE